MLENDYVLGINPPREILLGQTIYFQAVEDPIQTPEHQKKLLIIPLEKVNERHNPKLSGVKFTVEKREGDKLGVYYDEKKDEHGKDLDSDIIRLIGRYWKEGQKYSVMLTATTSDRNGHMLVEVKKPAKLGDTHNTANDVKLSPYNLDSLIIHHAGIEGVLPQYLKAMISVETMGFFDPCYRYEVWQDIRLLQKKDKLTHKYEYESDSYSHYRILSSTDKGTPDIPTDHSNVRDASKNRQPYPGYKTIWDYYWNHRSYYGFKIYSDKEREKQHKDIFDTLSIRLYKKVADSLNTAERKVVTDTTNKKYYNWLRYEYKGGMENMVAQTRLYASYGLLQLVYYGGEEYPQNNSDYRPEEINDHSKGFKYGVKHLVNKFNWKSILNKCFDDPTWQNGLEANYFKAITAYNGTGPNAIKHANKVIEQVPTFLPKK